MSRNLYTKGGLIYLTFLLLILAILPGQNSVAQAADGCSLTQDDFRPLAAISLNADLDYLGRIKSELVVRKTLLTKTVDCAIAEADSLNKELGSVSFDDERIKSIVSELAGRITDAMSYYSAEKTKISGLGLTGSRTFAQDFRDWRNGNYKPAAKEASTLLLWNDNQNLIEKARTRIDQIGGTMVILKIINSEDIQTSWKEAQNNFQSAIDANQKAIASVKSRDPDKAMEFIHDSLAALAQTYQNFLVISKVFNPSSR